MLEHFHFLRPWWLLALLVLAPLLWHLMRQRGGDSGWQRACDAHLLPYLLSHDGAGQRARAPWLLLGCGWLLVVIALAGPVIKQLPQPVFTTLDARVLVLDLSRSMGANDIKPSRLTRARYKVLDILDASDEGQTALVVFADEAYVVSPLTTDAATIAAMVPSLDSSLMPRQGSHPGQGLRKADQLLTQGNVPRGEIILITDSAGDAQTLATVRELHQRGRRISVLAVGTPEGAPIPSVDGGFIKDRDGNIVIPSLDTTALRELAAAGGGRYVALRADQKDVQLLLGESFSPPSWDERVAATQQKSDAWREEGPWLLLLVLPLAALAFRRGWLLAVVLSVAITHPAPSWALEWGDLWLRPDQQGQHLLEQNRAREAAQRFDDPAWKAQALYRAGEYEQAAQLLESLDSADADYNRGNALARAGRLQAALDAYQQALQKAPGHADAEFNRALIERMLDPQKNQNPQQQDQQQQEKQSEDQQGQQNPNQQNQGQQQDSQQSDSQQQDDSAGTLQQQQSDHSEEQDAAQQQDTAQPQQRDDAAASDDDEQKDAQQAMSEQRSEDDAEAQSEPQSLQAQESTQSSEEEQAVEQWLRRIPDDPGGLLRRKFLRQSEREKQRRQGNFRQSDSTW